MSDSSGNDNPFSLKPMGRRRAGAANGLLALLLLLAAGDSGSAQQPPAPFHVRPGMEIQEALDRAAADPLRKEVRVHAGTYRPSRPAQALVWFNRKHDGITLQAIGDVTLTAANTELADPQAASYPALVHHVVYFGDGIGRSTVLRGFKITGANNFFADAPEGLPAIEPALNTTRQLQEHKFFYSDGGGIKIFGRSYPTIENVEVHDNFASACGAGISIEHRGYDQQSVLLRNCIIRGNRVTETGAGVDVLPHSALQIENCLFVGNISNEEQLGEGAYNREHGSGALTVFPGSRVKVTRSTFTGNWNGVDDRSSTSEYIDSIFWNNTADGGTAPGERYEMDVKNGRGVVNCAIHGGIEDLQRSINPENNRFDMPDPLFDVDFRPTAPGYEKIGFRPSADGSAQNNDPNRSGGSPQ